MDETKEIVIQTVQLSTISDIFAIILSIVALFVTVIGFFASLKFYQDGVALQKSANDALSKLEEKTQNIQDQIIGMFDKTLDAAISKGTEIDSSFDALDQKVEDAKTTIIEQAIAELGQAGATEREKIESIVNDQLSRLEDNITSTRALTEGYMNKNSLVYKVDKNTAPSLIKIISESESPLTMKEISFKSQLPYMVVKSTVHRLKSKGIIESNIDNEFGTARYKLSA